MFYADDVLLADLEEELNRMVSHSGEVSRR